MTTEQLWARKTGELLFELCCIPFFVYGSALGDIVETDEGYSLLRVAQPSGRQDFRVWFGNSKADQITRTAIADQLTGIRGLLEWSSPNLLAVDAANDSDAAGILAFLTKMHHAGTLIFERSMYA
jgi:hypothetical protein